MKGRYSRKNVWGSAGMFSILIFIFTLIPIFGDEALFEFALVPEIFNFFQLDFILGAYYICYLLLLVVTFFMFEFAVLELFGNGVNKILERVFSSLMIVFSVLSIIFTFVLLEEMTYAFQYAIVMFFGFISGLQVLLVTFFGNEYKNEQKNN